MPIVTTEGLQNDATTADTDISDVKWAAAAGTADAITATYEEEVEALVDGLILAFRASAANETTTPTFNPDGLGAKTIVKAGGVALAIGDIPGAGAECLVRYRLSATRWELLNPFHSKAAAASWADATGGVDAIEATTSPTHAALEDGLLVAVRASGANTVVAPTFALDGLPAKTITRLGGVALVPGSIYGDGHELLLRYNATSEKWELLNPASPSQTLYKSLAADATGANSASAQPWFPSAGAVSLAAGTYRFRGQIHTSRAAGSTSHTTATLFGGTAVLASIDYLARAKEGDANDLQDLSAFRATAATALVVKAASTSTTEQVIIEVEGVVVVTTAGTLIPQFQYSAAPGGAPTIKRGTFFELTPVINPTGVWS